MKKDFFENKYKKAKELSKPLNKAYNTISTLRFIIFVIMFLSLIVAIYDDKIIYLIISLVSAVVFLGLIFRHNKVEWQYKENEAYLNKAEDYLKRFDYNFFDLEYQGLEFKEDSSFINYDLNIIGKGSIIQFINMAKSKKARKEQFRLFNELDSKEEILSRQEAASELTSNKELVFMLSSLISMSTENGEDIILSDNKLLNKTQAFIYKLLSYLYPVVSFSIFILSLFKVFPLYVAAIVVIVNIILVAIMFVYNRRYLENVIAQRKSLDIFVKVLSILEKEEFKSNRLVKMSSILNQGKGASNYLGKLVKLKQSIDSQQNILFYFLLNVFTLIDYRNVYQYNLWKNDLIDLQEEYVSIYNDIEVLLSLTTIELVIEQTSKPILSEDIEIKVDGLNNPLIKQNNIIKNNFNTENDNTFIITGSNMSGKTTFIRSIGINALLAYAGSSVCAKDLKLSLMKIYTSIRVEDDFTQGVSTFYAELNRIKEMVDYIEYNKPMLCLVDEIFKGTNSSDRIYGASKAIEKLNNKNVIAFITTHDSELTKLNNISNYHFEEYYENNEIRFDYTIKNGPSLSRNAKYLLKMVGILD
ncbi:MAG: hypothetical protein RR543_01900 [Erysipelotrichales bacterium]